MCVCVCVCVRAYVRTCVRAYVRTCVRAYVRARMRALSYNRRHVTDLLVDGVEDIHVTADVDASGTWRLFVVDRLERFEGIKLHGE